MSHDHLAMSCDLKVTQHMTTGKENKYWDEQLNCPGSSTGSGTTLSVAGHGSGD